VTVGRLAARVVEIVEEREALDQRMRVRRDPCRRTPASARVAIAGSHIAQDLIVCAVFTDDQEHVLDRRRIAEAGRDRLRFGIPFATGRGLMFCFRSQWLFS